MKCITCQHCDIKNHVAMLAEGMARCKDGKFYTFVIDRECSRYEDAAPDEVQRRREWYKKSKGKK